MNYLDLIIGIILIIFAILGYKRGLIIEAFYLAAFIIGIYGAMYFSDWTTEILSKYINIGKEYLFIIAFLMTFIVLIIIIRLLGKLISKLIEAICLGFIDKIGGFVFGILKGTLLTTILIMVLNMFNIGDVIKKETREKSFFYRTTEEIANILYQNHEIVENAINNRLKKGSNFLKNTIEKEEKIKDNFNN